MSGLASSSMSVQLREINTDAAGWPVVPHLQPVQTIAVAGGKGGDGTTSIAINLATALAQHGRQPLLLDGNLGLGDIRTLLGLRPRHDISHVLAGKKQLSEILIDGPAGLKIIPAADGNPDLARLSQIEHMGIVNLFSELQVAADTLVIDTESGISPSVLSFTRASREIIVVICDEPASLHDTFATIKILSREEHCNRFRIVANKTQSTQHGLDLYSKLVRMTDRYLDVLLDFCGSIPFDEQMQKAASEQRAVVEAYPRSRSAMSFAKLVSRIERWPRPLEPKGHLEFFVERLVQSSLNVR